MIKVKKEPPFAFGTPSANKKISVTDNLFNLPPSPVHKATSFNLLDDENLITKKARPSATDFF